MSVLGASPLLSLRLQRGEPHSSRRPPARCLLKRHRVQLFPSGRRASPLSFCRGSQLEEALATLGHASVDRVETATYRVKARLIEFKREDDKGHPPRHRRSQLTEETMIVEFPDTTCPRAWSSPKKSQMAKARSGLTNACGQAPGPSSDFADLKGDGDGHRRRSLRVKHSTPQTGVAPNNIALHPAAESQLPGVELEPAPFHAKGALTDGVPPTAPPHGKQEWASREIL